MNDLTKGSRIFISGNLIKRKSICTALKVYLYGLEKRKSLSISAKKNRTGTIVVPFYSLIFAEFSSTPRVSLNPA